MTTSIMMVTYNRLDLTKKTISNLEKTTNSEFRLIIVDNNSTDQTKEFLKDLKINNPKCLGIDINYNTENKGIAFARNQCLNISNKYQDQYLSTIDNDVELPNDWLTKCLCVVKANPKIAIGVSFEGKVYPSSNLNGFVVELKPAGNLGTACTVFERQLHKTIGFFTTEFGLYGEEDADFFYRARKVGYKMAYLKEHGIHLGEGEFDVGEYREFKTKCHQDNLNKFIKNCHNYNSGKKSCYVDFKY
jgi:GT2 family glycosyltransferase